MGVVVVAQVPTVEPVGRLQIPPGQQSPLMVQPPPVGMQATEAQCKAPVLSGTQGALLQQSAAAAHTSSALWQSPPARQRGTPKLSSLHISDFGRSGPQQSERADELVHA